MLSINCSNTSSGSCSKICHGQVVSVKTQTWQRLLDAPSTLLPSALLYFLTIHFRNPETQHDSGCRRRRPLVELSRDTKRTAFASKHTTHRTIISLVSISWRCRLYRCCWGTGGMLSLLVSLLVIGFRRSTEQTMVSGPDETNAR